MAKVYLYSENEVPEHTHRPDSNYYLPAYTNGKKELCWKWDRKIDEVNALKRYLFQLKLSSDNQYGRNKNLCLLVMVLSYHGTHSPEKKVKYHKISIYKLSTCWSNVITHLKSESKEGKCLNYLWQNMPHFQQTTSWFIHEVMIYALPEVQEILTVSAYWMKICNGCPWDFFFIL